MSTIDNPNGPRHAGDPANAPEPGPSALVTAIATLAARPGARMGAAGLVLGACIAAFGTSTARFEAGVDADLRALHGLDRLDRLVDEAGAQLMRARVAPRREIEAGTRGAFHRLTALSFQAEQTRGDLIAGVHGGTLRAEMADMLSADRRLWDLLADESGLVREGAVAMASRLRGRQPAPGAGRRAGGTQDRARRVFGADARGVARRRGQRAGVDPRRPRGDRAAAVRRRSRIASRTPATERPVRLLRRV